MSRTRMYAIQCDGDGCPLDISWPFASTATREARAEGWTLGKRDLCPDCQYERRCPHDGRRLEWVYDQLYCPQCGDKWPDEAKGVTA